MPEIENLDHALIIIDAVEHAALAVVEAADLVAEDIRPLNVDREPFGMLTKPRDPVIQTNQSVTTAVPAPHCRLTQPGVEFGLVRAVLAGGRNIII